MSDILSFSDQLADAVAHIAGSVVQVQGRRRPASGVVVKDSLVLTTARALGREEVAHVRRPDGSEAAAELAGWDPATSLVLLKVPELGLQAVVPSTTLVRVGHLAVAVARSWSNNLTATAGIVSIVGGPLRTSPGRSIDRVIRTTAPMHSGFAGGALVDGLGQLTGIATATEIRGLGVVIPADIALKTAEALAEHGTLKRGYLGIAGQPVRISTPEGSGDRGHRVLVVAVAPGSPAEKGGILVGDILMTFDGRAVRSPMELLPLLEGNVVGKPVGVTLVRGGETRELTLTVGEHA